MGIIFPASLKRLKLFRKRFFPAFLAVLTSKDLFSYSIKQKKHQQQQQSKRKLQILTQYNGLTPLEKSNMATPTTGLYKRSVRPF